MEKNKTRNGNVAWNSFVSDCGFLCNQRAETQNYSIVGYRMCLKKSTSLKFIFKENVAVYSEDQGLFFIYLFNQINPYEFSSMCCVYYKY